MSKFLSISAATTQKFRGKTLPQPITPETPRYRDIRIANLTATSPQSAGHIVGLPECVVSNLTLENVRITAPVGLTIRNAKEIRVKGVKVESSSSRRTFPPRKRLGRRTPVSKITAHGPRLCRRPATSDMKMRSLNFEVSPQEVTFCGWSSTQPRSFH